MPKLDYQKAEPKYPIVHTVMYQDIEIVITQLGEASFMWNVGFMEQSSLATFEAAEEAAIKYADVLVAQRAGWSKGEG